MSSFWSNLVGSFAGTRLKQIQLEKGQEIQGYQAQLDTLVNAAASGNVKPEYLDSVKEQIDELQTKIAGKKSKGGFHISNLLGHFQDSGGQTQKGQAGSARGGATQNSGAAARTPSAPLPGGGMVPALNLGEPPTRQNVPRGTSSFGETVTKGIKSSADKEQEKLQNIYLEDKARAKAAMETASEEQKEQLKFATDQYMKANPNATGPEVYKNVIAPMLHLRPPLRPKTEVVADSTSPTGWSYRTTDENDGTLISSQPGAPQPASEKPSTKETPDERKKRIVADYMELTGKSEAEANKWYDKVEAGKEVKAATTTAGRTTPAQINARVNSALSTFKKTLTDANKAVHDAQTLVNALGKEKRGEGNLKRLGVEQGIQSQDISKAQKSLVQAQQVAARAQNAMNFWEDMRSSLIAGTTTQEIVEQTARGIADGTLGPHGEQPPGK